MSSQIQDKLSTSAITGWKLRKRWPERLPWMEEEPFFKTSQTNANQFSQFTENKDRLMKIENPQHLGARRNCEKLLGPTHCLLVSQNLSKQVRKSELLKTLYFTEWLSNHGKGKKDNFIETPRGKPSFPFSLPCFSPVKAWSSLVFLPRMR